MNQLTLINNNLSSIVKSYIKEATSQATRKAYRTDLKHFQNWGGSIPSNPNQITDYLVYHAEILSIATLNRRLSSLSIAHKSLGHETPTKSELVRVTFRGIKRKHGTAQRQVEAIVKEDMLLILASIGNTHKDTRDKALLLLGFCTACRRSELVALTFEDIEFKRQGLVITIKRSKTDQTGKGRQVAVPYGRGHICPVKTLKTWLERAKITQGFIFPSIAKGGNISIKALSPYSVSLIIKARTKAVGMNSDNYSGHSLRAGLATSAASAGVSTIQIMNQTGHKSETTLRRYIRTGDLFINNPVASIF